MNTTTITVTGMSCDGCASAVRAGLTEIPGVVDVNVDLSSGEVTVGSDRPVDAATLRDAVEEAGYEVTNEHRHDHA